MNFRLSPSRSPFFPVTSFQTVMESEIIASRIDFNLYLLKLMNEYDEEQMKSKRKLHWCFADSTMFYS